MLETSLNHATKSGAVPAAKQGLLCFCDRLPFCLSTFATTSFDNVAHAQQLATPEAAGSDAPPPPPPRVFQLYVLRDRERVSGLLSRAARAGFRHLVLTADLTW